MCNCIETFEKLLRERLNDKDGRIPKTYYLFSNPAYTSPALYFEYNKLKNDGTREKKTTRQPIVPMYCPFCGKPYPSEETGIALT